MRIVLVSLLSFLLAASVAPTAAAACSNHYSSQTPVLTSPTITNYGNACDWGYGGGYGYGGEYNETRVTESYTGASVVYFHSSYNSTYYNPGNGTDQGSSFDTVGASVENTHGGPVPRVYLIASQSENTVNGAPVAGGASFTAGYSGGILGYYYLGGPVPTGNTTALPNVLRLLR